MRLPNYEIGSPPEMYARECEVCGSVADCDCGDTRCGGCGGTECDTDTDMFDVMEDAES